MLLWQPGSTASLRAFGIEPKASCERGLINETTTESKTETAKAVPTINLIDLPMCILS